MVSEFRYLVDVKGGKFKLVGTSAEMMNRECNKLLKSTFFEGEKCRNVTCIIETHP